jgi:hypothetical protein
MAVALNATASGEGQSSKKRKRSAKPPSGLLFELTSPSASARFFRTGAFCCRGRFWRSAKKGFPEWNPDRGPRFISSHRRTEVMLVERGLQVMNVEAIGDAYAIASNYLRRTGTIADTIVTNDRLLEIIVGMFHDGEYNRLRLANKAISQFEAVELA